MTPHAPVLSGLRFDDRFVRSLPGDKDPHNYPRPVLGAAYTEVKPTPVAAPALLAVSPEVLALLGIPPEAAEHPQFAEVFSGNRLLPGMRPYAANYGGHQFGSWAGQLGDGRAIVLGEQITPSGERLEVQLKGAGPTPYSRRADGRAVLRSSVREFLCSEAMFHLGIPTTRALSLVSTGERVLRDMFYDGRAEYEPGAIVTRVAPSFLRIGSFELFASRGETELLTALLLYAVREHFPSLPSETPRDAALALLTEVCERSARLVADWQRVGFIHGVLNTDNTSLLGLTIDYGPYGWLESFDPDFTPNTTDAERRRYRFVAQPAAIGWNLARLAVALHPLVGEGPPLQEALDHYGTTLAHAMTRMWNDKLGLTDLSPETDPLLDELIALLQLVETDYTLFFRHLPDIQPDPDDLITVAPLTDAFYTPPDPPTLRRLAAWLRLWDARSLSHHPSRAARRAHMNLKNPRYILRNWLAQQAIDRATAGDPHAIRELLDVLRRPYDDQAGRDSFAVRRPEWARHRAGCSMLSCSS